MIGRRLMGRKMVRMARKREKELEKEIVSLRFGIPRCRHHARGAAVVIDDPFGNKHRYSYDEFMKIGTHPTIRMANQIRVVDHDGNPIREEYCRWTHFTPRECSTCPLYEPKIIGQIKISKELADDLAAT